jgi:ubiquinone/menaquinone biosynthesis C-methylase UbiE
MTGTANAEQRAAWDGDSGHRWVADAARRDRVLAPVATALLAGADLRSGEQVLDVGCGCGATTLAAAGQVAPGGRVTGLDLSGPMLALARRRAADQGLANVDLVQGDAQTHPLPAGRFSAAISRFGTMFFDDQVVAFANVRRGLAPSGRLCLATWQPLAANDWLSVPGAALLRYGTLPDTATGGPGMFGMSEPDLVTATLRSAGYRAVHLDPVTLDLRLGDDTADATDYLANSGIGRAVLETVPDDHRPAALAAVRTVLDDHADATGVHLGAGVWIITATTP